jgi:hypothetical protein
MNSNPFHNLTHDRPLPRPALRKVKVVRAGWYGPDRKPVALDQVIEVGADDASGLCARGLAVYVQ